MSKAPVSINDAPQITIHIHNTNETLTGWTGFQVVRSIDSACDTFAFSFPFDPTEQNRKRFLPYSPGVVEIYGGDELFLKGYIEVVSASTSGNIRKIELQGRSASGAILEWSAGSIWDRAAQAFSDETVFEIEGLTFNQIARKIAGAHIISASPDTAVIPELSIDPGQTIFDVLGKLASVNGYFGVPQPNGSLIYKNNLGDSAPVADIIEGTSPVVSITTTHDVTKRFWKYKVIGDVTGQTSVSAESKDTDLSPAIRGIKIIKPDQQSTDYQNTADIARMMALIEGYPVAATLTGFAYNDSDGNWNFWKAGDTVNVYAPGAFIFTKTKLIVKRVSCQLDESGGQQTVLEMGFPGIYSGEMPTEKPWVI